MLEKLESSLQKHNSELTPFAKHIFIASDLATQVATNINLPYLCNSAKINDASKNINSLIAIINEEFDQFKSQTNFTLTNNYVTKLQNFENSISVFEERFNTANEALSQLKEKEIETLIKDGNNNYSTNPSNKNLKAIYDFLNSSNILANSIINNINLF